MTSRMLWFTREALEMLEISFPTRVNIFHIWAAELTQFLHQLMPAHYLGKCGDDTHQGAGGQMYGV